MTPLRLSEIRNYLEELMEPRGLGDIFAIELLDAVDQLTDERERARVMAVGAFTSPEGDESRLSHALNDTCEFCGHSLLDGTEDGTCWGCFQNWPKPVAT